MARTAHWQPRTLEERIDRIESTDQIRQLASRYGLAVDSRNMEDLVELFVEDVRVGKDEYGREALRAWYVRALCEFQTTIHFVGNHVIDFADKDHATGTVYCHDELDRRNDWAAGYLTYWDSYERRNGLWYFARRKFHRWYIVDVLERPSGGVDSQAGTIQTGVLPQSWPSWDRYWKQDVPKYVAASGG